MYFDAHNHLAAPSLAPHLPQILADLTAARVTHAVVNGTEESDWSAVAALCAAAAQPSPPFPQLSLLPSFGLHPWDVGNRSPAWLEALRTHLVSDPRAAVGEIGLDRWIIDGVRADAGNDHIVAITGIDRVVTAKAPQLIGGCTSCDFVSEIRATKILEPREGIDHA